MVIEMVHWTTAWGSSSVDQSLISPTTLSARVSTEKSLLAGLESIIVIMLTGTDTLLPSAIGGSRSIHTVVIDGDSDLQDLKG